MRVSATIKNKNPWDINIRNEHKNLLKSYKKLCSKKQREFWVEKNKELNDKQYKPEFWEKWKTLDESYHQDKMNIDPHKWFAYFSQLHSNTVEKNELLINHVMINKEINSEFKKPFTKKELTEFLNNSKNN